MLKKYFCFCLVLTILNSCGKKTNGPQVHRNSISATVNSNYILFDDMSDPVFTTDGKFIMTARSKANPQLQISVVIKNASVGFNGSYDIVDTSAKAYASYNDGNKVNYSSNPSNNPGNVSIQGVSDAQGTIVMGGTFSFIAAGNIIVTKGKFDVMYGQ